MTGCLDLIDYLASNVLLPIGGFALALFAGWPIPVCFLREQLQLGERGAAALLVLPRYVAPAGMAGATLGGIFIAR